MRDFNSNCLLFSPERLETGDKSRRFFFSSQPISVSNIETHFLGLVWTWTEYWGNSMIQSSVASSNVNNAQNFAQSLFQLYSKDSSLGNLSFLEILVTLPFLVVIKGPKAILNPDKKIRLLLTPHSLLR